MGFAKIVATRSRTPHVRPLLWSHQHTPSTTLSAGKSMLHMHDRTALTAFSEYLECGTTQMKQAQRKRETRPTHVRSSGPQGKQILLTS